MLRVLRVLKKNQPLEALIYKASGIHLLQNTPLLLQNTPHLLRNTPHFLLQFVHTVQGVHGVHYVHI